MTGCFDAARDFDLPRHYKAMMLEEAGIRHVLAETQLRHELGGVDVYRHVTDSIRDELRGLLGQAWLEAL